MTLNEATLKAIEYANNIHIQISVVLKDEHNVYSIACVHMCVNYQLKRHPDQVVKVYDGGWIYDYKKEGDTYKNWFQPNGKIN